MDRKIKNQKNRFKLWITDEIEVDQNGQKWIYFTHPLQVLRLNLIQMNRQNT